MSNNFDIYNDHIDLDIIKLLSTIYDDDLNLQYLYNYNKNCALIIDKTKDYYSLPLKPKPIIENFDYYNILKSTKFFYY
tara:strand:+ start:225 stop:461 length:237 start_codon:yes stop_codon:yes gene_type:complete